MLRMLSKFLTSAGTAALIVLPLIGHGDDTDIYVRDITDSATAPRLMFSIDYRPNLASTTCSSSNRASGNCEADEYFKNNGLGDDLPPLTEALTFFDIIRLSLKLVLSEAKSVGSNIEIGIMLNHDNRNNCQNKVEVGCSNGGYILFGLRSLQGEGTLNDFLGKLNAIPLPQGNLSHSYQGKELFFEFFRYLTGQQIYNGHVGFTDFGGDRRINLDKEFPAISWDTSIENENPKRYKTPLATADECAQFFTVNMLFQASNQEDDSDAAIRASKANGGMAGINLDGPNNSFATVIAYLNDIDLADGTFGTAPDLDGKQNVTSYFLVSPRQINNTTNGYARAGGTNNALPLSDDPEELVETLRSILRQVLAVSTTFVSASVPVNVFNRASIVDNVYLALFQAESPPYWRGNVKKLKIEGLDTNAPKLVDARGEPAVANDGRINFNALTFWTDTGSDANGDPLLPAGLTSDGQQGNNIIADRDGRHVDRGAAGQQIPGYYAGNGKIGDSNAAGTRQLFYDEGNTLAPLDVASSTTDSLIDRLLGTLDEANEMVRYMRGQDVDDLDGDGNTSEARPWILGAPLHSKPLPLNYGELGGYTQKNPAIYIAMGSDDGYLRMIRNTNPDGSESGAEVWAFMPESMFGIQEKLRKNAAGERHPYGMDGAPVAIFNDKNGNGTIETGDSVTLIIGQRRGGSRYYGLDVTNPESPSLLWKIEPSGDFAELGLTFSTPQTGKLAVNGSVKDIIVFGGGYDTNKDAHTLGSDDSIGRAIFVVDAANGNLIWKAMAGSPTGNASAKVFLHAGMKDSIPSDTTIADTSGDGLIDRIVVGDSGGSVWRADLHTDNPSDWALVRLGRLGRHDTNDIANDRRFFHAPDLVQTRDGNGPYDAVVITAGDRANPLDAGGTPENWAFMIKDRQVTAGSGTELDYTIDQLADITDNCLQNGTAASCGLTTTLDRGWALELEATGEKGLSSPLTFGGTIFFTTFIPPGATTGAACGPAEGSGRLYAIDLQDGTPEFNFNRADDADGQDGELPNTARDRYDELQSGGIPAEAVFIPPGRILAPDLSFRETGRSNRFRTYWQLIEPAQE